jgi:hypothetical protein
MLSRLTALAANDFCRKKRDFSCFHPKKRHSKSPLNIEAARRLTINGQQSASACVLVALDILVLSMTLPQRKALLKTLRHNGAMFERTGVRQGSGRKAVNWG